MAVRDILPTYGLNLSDISLPILGDDEFSEVYDAYEEFYRAANRPDPRGIHQPEAGAEFMDAVADYYEADQADIDQGWAASMPLAGTLDVDLTEEKLSEEELRNALEG